MRSISQCTSLSRIRVNKRLERRRKKLRVVTERSCDGAINVLCHLKVRSRERAREQEDSWENEVRGRQLIGKHSIQNWREVDGRSPWFSLRIGAAVVSNSCALPLLPPIPVPGHVE